MLYNEHIDYVYKYLSVSLSNSMYKYLMNNMQGWTNMCRICLDNQKDQFITCRELVQTSKSWCMSVNASTAVSLLSHGLPPSSAGGRGTSSNVLGSILLSP